MPEKLWTQVCNTVQEAVIKIIPKEKNAKRENGFPGEALQIDEKRSARQRRKGKIYSSECRVPKNSKERLKKKQTS